MAKVAAADTSLAVERLAELVTHRTLFSAATPLLIVLSTPGHAAGPVGGGACGSVGGDGRGGRRDGGCGGRRSGVQECRRDGRRLVHGPRQRNRHDDGGRQHELTSDGRTLDAEYGGGARTERKSCVHWPVKAPLGFYNDIDRGNNETAAATTKTTTTTVAATIDIFDCVATERI